MPTGEMQLIFWLASEIKLEPYQIDCELTQDRFYINSPNSAEKHMWRSFLMALKTCATRHKGTNTYSFTWGLDFFLFWDLLYQALVCCVQILVSEKTEIMSKNDWKAELKRSLFSPQYKYELIIVIRGRVCHFSKREHWYPVRFELSSSLNSMFRGNAMDSEAAVEELKVLCRQASRYYQQWKKTGYLHVHYVKIIGLVSWLGRFTIFNFFCFQITSLTSQLTLTWSWKTWNDSVKIFFTGIFEEISIKYIILCWINFPS